MKRHLLDEYSYSELKEIYDYDEIVDLMLKDSDYVEIINELIVNDITVSEVEGFEDINNTNIRIKKFRKDQGDDVIVELLEKAGYKHDICCVLADDYDISFINFDTH